MPPAKRAGHSTADSYYAVRVGRRPGVYNTWEDCKHMTQGFPGAVFKKFKQSSEAQAFVGESVSVSRYMEAISAVDSNTKKVLSQSRPTPPPVGETENEIVVYTDGASAGNGRRGAVAGVGVYFGENDPRNISEPLEGERQTNQRAELTAILRAIQSLSIDSSSSSTKAIRICTDSMYSINCLTTWFRNWERNGWMGSTGKPVENQDIIQKILNLIRLRINNAASPVRFLHVRGHAGVPGNEAADQLAVAGAKRLVK
ncbi:Rnase h protein 1.0, isoform c, confirmed by transcript evidence [Coemansia reversa NRRL 1564]|uniref:Ribonuclease H n=1 Tax=Coemansia reversa (strain ATCC 12441 / NRRL 1564) TaxID=763665 RepID=A0A2G5B1R1_COERN|nr:Rnase h protein 1.0, isoform c, confirmed by transcript evidence [Coemansia reversa NRRL 1564]|eukprot:PIA12953.1 Rnase h protein 1.0, isoform c, confirmed by transcript evidence [Coemansia reversa NRRL 1564]